MDLNDKLAARRREISEQVTLEKAAQDASKKAEQDLVNDEVAKRLGAMGVSAPASPVVLNSLEKSINKKVEKALDDAAWARFTTGQKVFAGLLAILGIISMFGAWPLGIALLVWCGWYCTSKVKKYRKLILEEGQEKLGAVAGT